MMSMPASGPTNVSWDSIPARCYLSVEFVVGYCLSQRVFLRSPDFLLPQKKISPNLNSTRIEEPHEKPDVASSLNVENFINTSCMEELLHCM